MIASEQNPASTAPTPPVPSERPSGIVFTLSDATRPVYINEGVAEIQGPTRLQYVPYQRTIIDYQQVETIQYVPVERKVVQYQERRRIQQVPIEETVRDYYAIEYITQYVPQVIPQKKIEYVPVEKIQNRVQYYPIERQVIYYPNQRQQYLRSQLYQSQLSRESAENVPYYGDQVRVNYNKSVYAQRPEGFQRAQYTTAYTGHQGKSVSYVSPIEFTLENISPRVSNVSTPILIEEHPQIEKKSSASSKRKSRHSKKSHSSKFKPS